MAEEMARLKEEAELIKQNNTRLNSSQLPIFSSRIVQCNLGGFLRQSIFEIDKV